MGIIAVGLLAGLFGVAYMIYGKRSMNFVFLVAGFLLVFYPFMVGDLTAAVLIGSFLVVGPIIINKYY